MRYSPVELRHVKVGRAFFGYRRSEVDAVISDATESYEEVWAERGELADKLEDLSSTLEEVKQRETLLATTLVAAEKAAAEAVESAKRQGEVIIAEAHLEGRSIMRAALAERDRLFSESRRVETLLRAALGIVEESQALGGGDDSTHWPRHEDTREFHMAELQAELQAESEELPAADASSGFTWG
jgi:cell division septum initiation protein DivIVA